jgi:hypothetical protein
LAGLGFGLFDGRLDLRAAESHIQFRAALFNDFRKTPMQRVDRAAYNAGNLFLRCAILRICSGSMRVSFLIADLLDIMHSRDVGRPGDPSEFIDMLLHCGLRVPNVFPLNPKRFAIGVNVEVHLAAFAGGEPSDEAALWEYGAADRGAIASGGIAGAVGAGKSIQSQKRTEGCLTKPDGKAATSSWGLALA